MDLAKSGREVDAFNQMDKLEHKGDVQQWQIDSVTYITDLLDSKATIMDYVLHCVMKSLAGKSKTIQYRIADDINKNEINDATNIFDVIQDYATAMATVGDGKSKPTNFIDKTGYKSGDKFGRDKKPDKFSRGDKDKHSGPNKNKLKNKQKNGKHCDYCGWDGHDISECRKKKAADEAAKGNRVKIPISASPFS